MTITFETKFWEKDKDLVLDPKNLSEKISRCHYNFDVRALFINNVDNFKEASDRCRKLIDDGVIDKYVIVEKYADEALSFFGLSRDSFGIGYYYSIQELVSIYLCETDYLLHFSSDTMVCKEAYSRWLIDALYNMDNNENISVFNLTWNNKYEEAKQESFGENKECYLGYGFSDQMYLIRTKDFRDRIYDFKHEHSERYPDHGGELFEKRVDAWMRTNNKIRATYKFSSYIHPTYEG